MKSVRFLLSETRPEMLGASVAEVTFVGRSNVGKSSLLNALCGHVIARVSKTPGRTRTINVFETGHHRWLVDLPGYGYAKVAPKERKGWGHMIENYLTGRPNLRMVFSLIDAQVGPTFLDQEMHRWLDSQGLPWRVIATKCDQVKPSRFANHKKEVARVLNLLPENISWVSAHDGTGIPRLKTELNDLLQSKGKEGPSPEVFAEPEFPPQ